MTRDKAGDLVQRVRDMANVMEAYAAGKKVQLKDSSSGKWVDFSESVNDTPDFYVTSEYRIKPEPKVWWELIYPDDSRCEFRVEDEAKAFAKTYSPVLEVRKRQAGKFISMRVIRCEEIL